MMQGNGTVRWLGVALVATAVFAGAYAFAQGRSGATAYGQDGYANTGAPAATAPTPATPDSAAPATGGSGPGAASAGASAAGGCACCGGGGAPTAGGVTGSPVEGTAKLDGGVQRIAVDVTTVYNPNVIKLKAGVPAEITFSGAQGCTGQVISNDLGFSEDLTTGPKTVKLSNLKPGEYAFSCGMSMVFGKVVVE